MRDVPDNTPVIHHIDSVLIVLSLAGLPDYIVLVLFSASTTSSSSINGVQTDLYII